MSLKYYKDQPPNSDYLYALDEDGNLFRHSTYRGTSWRPMTECTPLEAVVLLGSDAFPRGRKHRWLGRLFGYLIINPLKAIKRACEGNASFIWGSMVITFVALSLCFCVMLISMGSISMGQQPNRPGIPTSITIQYSNNTTLQYPIQNVKPKAVEVEK